MPEERERIDVLREELDIELQTAQLAQAELGPVTAADPTGSITVHLDAEGAVSTVHSDGSWRQRLGPTELPGAVLQAYAAAAAARQELYVIATGEAEPGRARPAPVESGLSPDLVAQLQPRLDDMGPSMLMALNEMLEDLDRAADEAFAKIEERVDQTVTGRSTSGHARVVMSGSGDLVSVDYDERWLGSAHAFNVGRETTEAIHDAARLQAVHSTAAVLEESGLARLQQLTADPQAFGRFLGL